MGADLSPHDYRPIPGSMAAACAECFGTVRNDFCRGVGARRRVGGLGSLPPRAPVFGRPVPPTFGVPATSRAPELIAPAWQPLAGPPEPPTIGAQLGMDGTTYSRADRPERPQSLGLWQEGESR